MLESIEYLSCFSCSSESETLVPSSTQPRRSTALALNKRASARDVLPATSCPTSAMVRMSSVLWLIENPRGEGKGAGTLRVPSHCREEFSFVTGQRTARGACLLLCHLNAFHTGPPSKFRAK